MPNEAEPSDMNEYLASPEDPRDPIDYATLKENQKKNGVMDDEDYGNKDRIYRNYYTWKKRKENKGIDAVENAIRAIENTNLEALLYQEQSTRDVMDYNDNNYNYYFKWQWERVRFIAQKYKTNSKDLYIGE